MELRQLRYVVAVAQYSNFTRAAASLHVAQPALSTQIRNLERELGVELFERTTRRVRVTAAGLALVERAQRILAEVEETAKEMAEHSGGIRGTLRLGAWLTLNPMLPRLIAGFVRAHPAVALAIREENSDIMLDGLRAGELDVALATLCEGLDFTDIDRVVYLEEPLVLAASSRSALAVFDEMTIRQAAEAPLIMQKPGSALRRLVEEAFRRVGRAPRVAIETSQTAAVLELVAAGIGAAILPRSVAEGSDPGIRLVRFPPPPPMRVSVLAWRQGRLTPASKAFVAYARHALGA